MTVSASISDVHPEEDDAAKEKSKQELETGGLTGAVRAATAWLRAFLAQPRVRLFTPRRFQALHLIRVCSVLRVKPAGELWCPGQGGGVKPEQSAIPTARQIFCNEGMRGLTRRVALPLAANTASGTVLFAVYGAVEDWAAAHVARTGGLLALLELTQHQSAGSGAHVHGAAVPLSCVAFAGGVAGGVHAMVTCPLDNYLSKLHAQSLQPSASTPLPLSTALQETRNLSSAALRQVSAMSASSSSTRSISAALNPAHSHPQRANSVRRSAVPARNLRIPGMQPLMALARANSERMTVFRGQVSARVLSQLGASTSAYTTLPTHPVSASAHVRAHAPALRPSMLPRLSWLGHTERLHVPRIQTKMGPMPLFGSTSAIRPGMWAWGGGGGGAFQCSQVGTLGLVGSRSPVASWTTGCGLSTSATVTGQRLHSWRMENGGLSWMRTMGAPSGVPCGSLRSMATASAAATSGKNSSVHTRHLFTGLGISISRDIASYGVFFLTYEYAKARILAWNPSPPADPDRLFPATATLSQILRRPAKYKHAGAHVVVGSEEDRGTFGSTGGRAEELSLLGTILAGAVSGATFRVVSFPIDWGREFWAPHPGNAPPHPLSAEAAVRCRLNVHTGIRGGTWRSIRMLRRIYGPGSGFFPGLGWSIAGSVPAAALTFLAYEFAQQLVQD